MPVVLPRRAAARQPRRGRLGLRVHREAPRCLCELNQNDLRMSSHSHGWPPGARARGRVDKHLAETLQTVGIRSEDAVREPCERENLSSVCVTRQLQ